MYDDVMQEELMDRNIRRTNYGNEETDASEMRLLSTATSTIDFPIQWTYTLRARFDCY
jgi:hypothetical protein